MMCLLQNYMTFIHFFLLSISVEWWHAKVMCEPVSWFSLCAYYTIFIFRLGGSLNPRDSKLQWCSYTVADYQNSWRGSFLSSLNSRQHLGNKIACFPLFGHPWRWLCAHVCFCALMCRCWEWKWQIVISGRAAVTVWEQVTPIVVGAHWRIGKNHSTYTHARTHTNTQRRSLSFCFFNCHPQTCLSDPPSLSFGAS